MLHSKVIVSFAYCDILQGYCNDIILCTFSMAEPSKDPEKDNNRPNATWNMTRCKGELLSLSLRPFPKTSSVYFPLHVIRMHFLRICTHTQYIHTRQRYSTSEHEDVALQCLLVLNLYFFLPTEVLQYL